ncbi:hypothetical protein D3C73_1185110 [compost metagenome]
MGNLTASRRSGHDNAIAIDIFQQIIVKQYIGRCTGGAYTRDRGVGNMTALHQYIAYGAINNNTAGSFYKIRLIIKCSIYMVDVTVL